MDHEFQEDEVLGKAYDGRLMKRLLVYLKPHRVVVVISILLLVGTALLELLGPYLIKIAIDREIAEGDRAGLIKISLLYLATLAGAFLLGYAQTYLMQRMGQRVMVTLRKEIFAHLQKLQVQYFDRNPVGRLITRLTSDVEALNEMFTSGVVAIFGDIITLVGIMGVLLWLNVKLALVSFAVLPFLFLVSRWFRKNARDSYRKTRLHLARLNSYLQESITGMPIIHIMNREKRSEEEFGKHNRNLAKQYHRSIFYYATFYPVVELLSSVALAGVIWIGGSDYLSGTFTLGGLVAFIQYVRRFYQPIQDLSEKYNILQGAMASSERIFGVLDTEPSIAAPSNPHKNGMSKTSIEFKNVWFAYLDENWVLEDVSFSVQEGESVAFVGATGSGKTTIMNLLLRFYDVQKGEVLVDGVNVKNWEPQELRRKMSLVLQDVFLFRGSVEENIKLGRDISQAEVEKAAKLVNADRFIQQMPQGLATEVGERGASLSTGQKQLLSFARAVVDEPEILILDEATSNVDTETEMFIQDALDHMMEGRTSLIVAHRLSTIQRVSRIVVLHKGHIREEGTHEALLKQRGIYYKLYQLQYKEQDTGAIPSAGKN